MRRWWTTAVLTTVALATTVGPMAGPAGGSTARSTARSTSPATTRATARAAVSVDGTPAGGGAAGRTPIWSWPVPAPHPVVRPFEAPSSPYAAGHRGIDVRAAVGTPVTAPQDGRVVFAGRLADRGVLSIQHAGDVRSSFEPVTARVRVGDAVLRGQPVADVATGGARIAGTLYIGARVHGQYISPLLLLGGLQRAVLLPVD